MLSAAPPRRQRARSPLGPGARRCREDVRSSQVSQKRPQHVAHDVLERAVGTAEAEVRPPAAARAATRRVGQTPRLPLPMSPSRRCARGRGRASARSRPRDAIAPARPWRSRSRSATSSRAADTDAGFVVSSVAAIRRTEPSSFDGFGQFEDVALLVPARTHRLAPAALSSVMMRLIEAIISSIEGSEGDLALSGIEAPTKAQALS